jgi:hypothetical protein
MSNRNYYETVESVNSDIIKIIEGTANAEDLQKFFDKNWSYITKNGYLKAIYAAFDGNKTSLLDLLMDRNNFDYVEGGFTYIWAMNMYLSDKRHDVFKWSMQWLLKHNVTYDISACFDLCCLFGEKINAEFLYSNYKIDITLQNYRPLANACFRKHLELAMWLDSMAPMSTNADDIHNVFKSACSQLDIALWFYNKYENLIRTYLPFDKLWNIFNNAVTRNSMSVVKWLYKTWDNKFTLSDQAFGIACRAGLYENVEWILETFPDTNIYKDDCYGMVSAVCRTDENENYCKIVDMLLNKYSAEFIQGKLSFPEQWNLWFRQNKEVQHVLSREIVRGNKNIINMCEKYNIKYKICEKKEGAFGWHEAVF